MCSFGKNIFRTNTYNGDFIVSDTMGKAVATEVMVGLAGTILSEVLEKCSADVAAIFVQMIESQSVHHANARTIRIGNEMLRELNNIIRQQLWNFMVSKLTP